MDKTNLNEPKLFDISEEGQIKRGRTWSNRKIFVVNNKLFYHRKYNKSNKVFFTIDKYLVTQHMDLQKNLYTFRIFEKISIPEF